TDPGTGGQAGGVGGSDGINLPGGGASGPGTGSGTGLGDGAGSTSGSSGNPGSSIGDGGSSGTTINNGNSEPSSSTGSSTGNQNPPADSGSSIGSSGNAPVNNNSGDNSTQNKSDSTTSAGTDPTSNGSPGKDTSYGEQGQIGDNTSSTNKPGDSGDSNVGNSNSSNTSSNDGNTESVGRPLSPAEQLAVDAAILQSLESAALSSMFDSSVERKPEQRVETIDQNKDQSKEAKLDFDPLEKLKEIFAPLGDQFAVESREAGSNSPQMEILGELTKTIDAYFTGPNGESFQLITLRDAHGNIIGHNYVNASGDIVSQSMVEEVCRFLQNVQTPGAAENWENSKFIAETLSGTHTAFIDGPFDIMDTIIEKAESAALSNDPFGIASNDPQNQFSNDPNGSPSSFISSWLLNGPEGGNIFDEITVHKLTDEIASSPLDMDLSPSLDPLSNTWVDPLVDRSLIAESDLHDPKQLADWFKDQKEKELNEHQRREREEAEAKARAEHQAREYAAAMMAAMKEASRRELAERKLAQEQLLQREMRKKYVVLPGDTLESIAQKMFYNKSLASLIYEINRSLIPVVLKEGKRKLQLKPRTIIFLPTASEITRFKSRMFGKTQTFEYVEQEGGKNESKKSSGFTMMSVLNLGARNTSLGGNRSDEKVVNLAERRRANIQNILGKLQEASRPAAEETDGRIVYSCRLGDSLRSIALRHPSLKDVSLWRLIAEVNNLSTELDENGQPTVVLSRNTKLKLPLPEEIQEFKKRNRKRLTAAFEVPSAMPEPIQESAEQLEKDPEMEELAIPENDYAPELDSLLKKMRVEVKAEELESKQYTILAERCRMSRSGEARGSSVPYNLSLEIKQNNSWITILSYEINGEQSWRYEITPSGSKKGKPIHLPIRLAKQMAENDLSKNWRQYVAAYNIAVS
ncbi:MAG: LysM peptidoglycan-binding domain-containing protein, partial [Candidatus Obscuribacterales bacterium]|nr:LysM peptidoglycan-binding domain-containing protein [Candidatus Obscuribacterales bacterium]